ncbi:addiction module toxin, HicA family [bacterium]|nr:addiction module toxin, HicA family [bacterium]
MPMTGKEMLKLLQKHGWHVVRIRGSHHIVAKDGVPFTIPVPVHGNEILPRGTEHQILKSAGLK